MTAPALPPLTLVVMAAGMGSRYGGLKQLEPVGPGGECIIDYSIHDAAKAGFRRAVFIVRPDLCETFEQLIGKRLEAVMPVELATQRLDDLPPPFTPPAGRSKPWGTAHALRAARHTVNTPFGLINADDYYGKESFELLASQLQTACVAPDNHSLVAFALRNTLSPSGTVSRGVCDVNGQSALRSIREHTKVQQHADGLIRDAASEDSPVFAGDEPVSMNMLGFHPSIFDRVEEAFRTFCATRLHESGSECYIPSVLDPLIQAGSITMHVAISPEPWYGITYREDKERIQNALANRPLPANNTPQCLGTH